MNSLARDMLNPRRRRPRNKFVAGCATVFTILGLLFSLGVWLFVGRPATQAFRSVQELQQAPALEAQLANRAPFAAPQDGLLARDQVERYIAVQESITEQLRGGISTLAERYEQVGGQEFQIMDVLRMAGAYRDYLQLLGDVRTAQVTALDAQGFSAGEYSWVRTEVLRAAGMPISYGGFEGLVGALSGQQQRDPAQDARTPVPPQNAALLQEMEQEMRSVTALAVLGF